MTKSVDAIPVVLWVAGTVTGPQEFYPGVKIKFEVAGSTYKIVINILLLSTNKELVNSGWHISRFWPFDHFFKD